MRQYCILYKRSGSADFARLEPNVHANLYDQPPIHDAVDIMLQFPHIEGMAIRVNGDLFNIMAFSQDAEAPLSFKFSPESSSDESSSSSPSSSA